MSSAVQNLLRLSDVLRLLKTSKSKLYDDISSAKFPAPIKNGRSSYWLDSEISSWQAALIAERDAKIKSSKK